MSQPIAVARSVRVAVTAAAVLVAAGLGPVAAEGSAEPATSNRLSCSGPFGPDASHASLVEIVGKKNAVFQMVDGAEGEKVGATVLFPNNPERRLELMWADEKKRRGLLNLGLSPTSTWVAPNGLTIGMSLAEIEKLNGRPFALSGFDWDYGGYVTDWKGGALGQPVRGGCTVQVRFTLPEDAPGDAASKVVGDTEFASTDPNMRKARPVVGSLAFGHPQP